MRHMHHMDLDATLPPLIRALPMKTGPVGVRRLTAPGSEVLLVTAAAGAYVPAHHHGTENETVIVSGDMILTTERGDHRYSAGDWYRTHPGETHAIRFESDTIQIELRFAATEPPSAPGAD